MSDKIFKPKKGDEIVIRVPRGKKVPGKTITTATGKPKGIACTRRPDDFLPRRLQKGGIQFFDFGQIKVGDAWRTNPFVVAPAVNNPTSNPAIRNLIIDDFTNRDAALNLNALDALARRIEKAHGELFRIKISGTGFEHRTLPTDPAWTSGGLKLTPEELAADNFTVAGMERIGVNETQSNRYFHQIKLTGAGKNHITNVYDFAAASALFAPSNSDKYFLIPSFVKLEGLLFSPFIKLGFVYSFITRFPEAPATKLDFNTLAEPSSNAAAFIAAANIAVNIPEVKAYLLASGSYVPYPVEDFPAGYNSSGGSIINQFQTTSAGALLAIIKQNANLFYIWK